MNRIKQGMAILTLALLGPAGVCGEKAAAWPRFRGPDGSGVADNQKPPLQIGPDKNVKWKVPAPSGLSSPVIAGDKLFITAFDGGKLYTVAYRRADGKELWRREAPAKQIEPYFKPDGSPAASTPATDGQRIVSYFGSCGVFCYDLDGKELWKHEMPMAAVIGNFGTGTSPILEDGLVVILRDEAKNSRIFALDASTGSPVWEKKRQSPSSFSTPIVWNNGGAKQVVVNGHARMIGYDLKTGAEKWTMSGLPAGPCTSPVAADGMVFFAGFSPGGPDDKEFQMPTFDSLLKDVDSDKNGILSRAEADKTFLKDFFDSNDGNNDGKITRDEWDAMLKFMAEGKSCAFALKPGGSGDITKSHVLWKKTKGLPHVSSAIAYRGQLVMVKDGGIVTAYDARTGKQLYQERAASGRYYASPVAANGNIYLTSLDGGAVTVLKAGAEKATIVAENPELGERIGATPAIADDTLYVRTEKHLYAFAAK